RGDRERGGEGARVRPIRGSRRARTARRWLRYRSGVRPRRRATSSRDRQWYRRLRAAARARHVGEQRDRWLARCVVTQVRRRGYWRSGGRRLASGGTRVRCTLPGPNGARARGRSTHAEDMMAIFDRENGKLVVRVVYDGPGNAGKTTNILEICRFFSTMRRGELVSPEEHAGRTLWFDWVQVDAGVVAGYGLRCQVVTVPGQLVLRRRRSALLRSADVVVLVCDSTPSGLARLRPAFGRVRQFI